MTAPIQPAEKYHSEIDRIRSAVSERVESRRCSGVSSISGELLLQKRMAIVELAALSFGASVEEIFSRQRPARIAFARHVAMALMYQTKPLDMSLEEVGAFFERDHGTIMHAIRAVSDRCDCEETVRAKVEELRVDIAAILSPPSPHI